MKEIIERAEKLGYKPYFFDNIWNYAEDEYIELCLIQKWLRDEHRVIIEIVSSHFYCKVYSYDPQNCKTDLIFIDSNFKTYEQALEEGIKTALEILEKCD